MASLFKSLTPIFRDDLLTFFVHHFPKVIRVYTDLNGNSELSPGVNNSDFGDFDPYCSMV